MYLGSIGGGKISSGSERRGSVQPRKRWRPRFDARPRLHFIGEPVFRLVSDPHGQMSSEGRDGCGRTVSITSSVSPFVVRMIGGHEITSVSVRL
jgi:hypothetical protein